MFVPPLGFFLFGCQCDCCPDESGLTPDKVLLWDTNCNAALTGLTAVKSVYTSLGITSHLSAAYTGTLSDYRLIIFLMAESDPTWWGQISGATWTGRIHFSGEYDNGVGQFPATITYVNGKSGLHGMTIANNLSNPTPGCNGETATSAAHQLTDGVSGGLKHGATASVSGGTTVFTNTTLALPMMQQAKPGGIDWVVCGDSSHLADHCPTAAAANKQFLCNLWRKPL